MSSIVLFGKNHVNIETYQGVQILDVRQGSVEWLLARAGMITASRICDAMKFINEPADFIAKLYAESQKCGECNKSFKGREWLVSMSGDKVKKRVCSQQCKEAWETRRPRTESADRYNYKIQLVGERMTGLPEEQFVTPEMKWGTDNEPLARSHYELKNEVFADTVGFGIHPDMPFAGASPDALIGKDGLTEIKCPKTATHIKWMRAGGVPEDHQEQCLFNMDVFGREWCDFMSYDPRLVNNPELKSYIVRMPRDEKRIKEIRAGVNQFNEEINELIYSLEKLCLPEVA